MPSSQTLQRGLLILRLLTRHGEKGLRMHEIEKKSKLNKTTAMRLTKTLVKCWSKCLVTKIISWSKPAA